MMRKLKRWHIIVVGIATILLFGLKEDIDYCFYTSESRRSLEFFGWPLTSDSDPGFRPWIEDELGVQIVSELQDYSDTFPIFGVTGTGPGNWMFLHSAWTVYNNDPKSHDAIRELVQSITKRSPPVVEPGDYQTLNSIQDPNWNKAEEQSGVHQPVTAPDSKSEGNEKHKPESEERSP
jgi:hypothetical protein